VSARNSPDSLEIAPHELLAAAILEAVKVAVAKGDLPAQLSSNAALDEITLERPKNRDHGDYATSIALALAKSAGKPPRQIAEIIAGLLKSNEIIERIDIAGPGFINITLVKASQGAVVNAIFAQGEKYGEVKILSGVKINLEFISANPTGPLHLGHTRWAAVGDALARVLIAGGAKVLVSFILTIVAIRWISLVHHLQHLPLARPSLKMVIKGNISMSWLKKFS